jgi:WbqC-like protein family.
MSTAFLSTAYLAPIQYYSKLVTFEEIRIEAEENYPKQTYRNRCIISTANGTQALTVPVEKPDTLKAPTRDIRISEHGNWRHLHWNALVSAYNMSPFFEYYVDDFRPFYEKKFTFLIDYNAALQNVVCDLIDIHPVVVRTSNYEPVVENDFRYAITPRNSLPDIDFKQYYQVFRDKHGFIPNLSIVDLLFNMGPESILYL